MLVFTVAVVEVSVTFRVQHELKAGKRVGERREDHQTVIISSTLTVKHPSGGFPIKTQ